MVDGGWIDRPGRTCLNLYRAPRMQLGDARKAQRWVDHFRKVYPDDADHAIAWLAQRVQHPDQDQPCPGARRYARHRQGHVAGGGQANGRAVELPRSPPTQLIGKINSFLRSVIVRLNEARDMGESGRVDRFGLYDHCKILLAAPPDVLRINEKYLREYYIFNCLGMVITTNHRDALYLPPEDRRHYVAWSNIHRNSSPRNTGTNSGPGIRLAASSTSPPIFASTTFRLRSQGAPGENRRLRGHGRRQSRVGRGRAS